MRENRPDRLVSMTRTEALPLGLLLAAATVARLPGLTESLWYDELWSTRVVLGNLGDTLRVLLGDVHPPLYTALMFAWTRMLGDSELSVRAIPLMAGLATIALMPALGARLATRNAGWVAALLLAMSPVHIWYSQEARAYSLTMLVTVSLVLTWLRLDVKGPLRWLPAAFIFLSVVLGQLHYFAVAVPAAIAASAIWRRRHVRVATLGLALSLLGVAAVLGTKWMAGVLATESGYLRVFTLDAARNLALSWFTSGNALSPDVSGSSVAARVVGYGMVGLTMALLAIWLVLGWKRLDRHEWRTHLLLLLAVPGVLLSLNVLGQRNYYIERSALPALPFFLLAVAAGVTLIAAPAIRHLALGTTMVLATLVLSAFRARSDEWTVYKPNPDWRTAAREISSERTGRTGRLAILSTTPLTELVYYLPGSAECPWPPATSLPRQDASSLMGTLARRFTRSRPLTCGGDGNAANRLYVMNDSMAQWVDEVRGHEVGASVMLVVNHYWLGKSRALLAALRSGGHSVRLVARAKGLDVLSLD